ncbi:MAG: SBBP repeat-containing protein [Blastocatellia bacterium]|nr:SBBP repeat-containing protein [Blastocatellia bacterium]
MEISASFKNRPVALKAGILWLTALLAFQVLPTLPIPARDVKPSNSSYETISSTSLKAKESYGKLPLSFEENRGQAGSRVKFISRGDGYTLFLTATEAVLKLRAGRESIRDREDKLSGPNPTVSNQQFSVLRVKLAGGASSPQAEGIDRLPGNNNYLIEGDPEKWRTQVPTYARVRYSEVYPGIDMIYYGDQRQLEYDFVLAPGADSRAIRLAFEGTRELRLDEQGDLLLETSAGEIRQRKPFAYQIANGIRQEVAVSYCIKSRKEVRFQLGAYDPGKQLIIDPVLSYATFLGGSGFDQGNDIAVDSDGNVYVTGYTLSADFPVMKDVFQNASGSSSDVFVAKLNSEALLSFTLHTSAVRAWIWVRP